GGKRDGWRGDPTARSARVTVVKELTWRPHPELGDRVIRSDLRFDGQVSRPLGISCGESQVGGGDRTWWPGRDRGRCGDSCDQSDADENRSESGDCPVPQRCLAPETHGRMILTIS